MVGGMHVGREGEGREGRRKGGGVFMNLCDALLRHLDGWLDEGPRGEIGCKLSCGMAYLWLSTTTVEFAEGNVGRYARRRRRMDGSKY